MGHPGARRVSERDVPEGSYAAGRPESAGALPVGLGRDALRLRGVAWVAADEPEAVPAGFHAVVGGAGRYFADSRDLAGMSGLVAWPLVVRRQADDRGRDVRAGRDAFPHV